MYDRWKPPANLNGEEVQDLIEELTLRSDGTYDLDAQFHLQEIVLIYARATEGCPDGFTGQFKALLATAYDAYLLGEPYDVAYFQRLAAESQAKKAEARKAS